MKKMISLRKLQVTMKTFVPPFFNHFSLNLNRKKTCVNESHESHFVLLRVDATLGDGCRI